MSTNVDSSAMMKWPVSSLPTTMLPASLTEKLAFCSETAMTKYLHIFWFMSLFFSFIYVKFSGYL